MKVLLLSLKGKKCSFELGWQQLNFYESGNGAKRLEQPLEFQIFRPISFMQFHDWISQNFMLNNTESKSNRCNSPHSTLIQIN